jgi:hypothetical protein
LFFKRKRLLSILFIQSLAIQALIRTITQKGFRVTFQPHEKFLIAVLYEKTPNA